MITFSSVATINISCVVHFGAEYGSDLLAFSILLSFVHL